MSTLEDLEAIENGEGKENKENEKGGKAAGGDTVLEDLADDKHENLIDAEILQSSTRDINMRRRLLDSDMHIMKSEYQRLTHEQAAMKEKIKENLDKIENNRSATLLQPDFTLAKSFTGSSHI